MAGTSHVHISRATKGLLIGLAAVVAVVLTACGGDTKTETQTRTIHSTVEVTVTAPQKTVTNTVTVP